MALNYLGTVHALQAALPCMLPQQGRGQQRRAVLVSSAASAIGFLG